MSYRILWWLLFSPFALFAQNIGINDDGSLPDNSALLDLKSNRKGLLVPRMQSSERLALSQPATGLLVYQVDNNSGPAGFYYNEGPSVNWKYINAAGPAGPEGTPGAPGPAGPPGAPGPPGPAYTETYGNAYNVSGSRITFAAGGNRVTLGSGQESSQVSINPAGDLFTILESGHYLVSYGINFTAHAIVQSCLSLNSVKYLPSLLAPAGAMSNYSYTGIVRLAKDDQLALEVTGPNGGSLDLQAGNGAYLNVIRLR